MPIIDTNKISPEIAGKYSIVNNSLRLVNVKNPELDKYNNAPKDLITVEVGDVKQQEFYPQVKLGRWGNSENDNEVNFSVRLKDTDYDKATISYDKDKTIWDKGNIKAEFYDFAEGEGSYKFVWYLKEKPKSNKVEFTIQSKGLDFFYQPPLTQEYQNGYSEEFQKEIVVTETQVKDLEGNVLVERPENVVGSYAVYHSTKGGMVDINDKDYKVGKAFHIYRPHLIDANGLEAWGNLHIENGIYSVEIPQDFLDKAVYPIKSNDRIGNQSTGSTSYALVNTITGGVYAGANGKVTGISICTNGWGSGEEVKAAMYSKSSENYTLLSPQSSASTAGSTDNQFKELSVANLDISLGTDYWIVGWTGSTLNINADLTGSTDRVKSQTYGSWPGTIASPSTSTRSRSVYATYTPSATADHKPDFFNFFPLGR